LSTVREAAQQLVAQVRRVVVGKGEAVEQLFAALLVDGHVLPGRRDARS
jgi:MoxR-like ATPase